MQHATGWCKILLKVNLSSKEFVHTWKNSATVAQPQRICLIICPNFQVFFFIFFKSISKNFPLNSATKKDHLKIHFPNLVLEPGESLVEKIMQPWIKEPGFPCVDVDVVSEEKDHSILHLSQWRYFQSLASYQNPQKWKTIWNVPIRLHISFFPRFFFHQCQNVFCKQIQGCSIFRKNLNGNTEFSKEAKFFFLTEKNFNLKIDDFKPHSRGDFFKLNSEQVGFYRVKYDDKKLLMNLCQNLEEKYVSATDRLVGVFLIQCFFLDF